MPRKKLSEYRTKTILCQALGTAYDGIEVDLADLSAAAPQNLPADGRYVVKLDQAVKGRFKKGLVTLNRTPRQVQSDLRSLRAKGYDYALVEPFVEHAPDTERYLAIERTRSGVVVSYAAVGGIDIESNASAVEHVVVASDRGLSAPAKRWGLLRNGCKNCYRLLMIIICHS